MTPEHISRPFGSYDPMEPFVISYGDLLAVRNAVIELLTILRDPNDPPSEYHRESVRVGIRYGVVPDRQPYHFDTFDQALTWLVELRDRLGRLLPDLPPGRREGI